MKISRKTKLILTLVLEYALILLVGCIDMPDVIKLILAGLLIAATGVTAFIIANNSMNNNGL